MNPKNLNPYINNKSYMYAVAYTGEGELSGQHSLSQKKNHVYVTVFIYIFLEEN